MQSDNPGQSPTPSIASITPISHVARQREPSGAWTTVVSANAFAQAHADISQWPGYHPTPLLRLNALAGTLGVGEILYKNEAERFQVGSFKALGAPYAAARVLSEALQTRGIAATPLSVARGELKAACQSVTLTSATDGNHGRALAWAARQYGAQCRIYIHSAVSDFREQAMIALGAEVVRINGDYDQSVVAAKQEAASNGWLVVSDTSWDNYTQVPADVMAGYGVMIDEIVDQLDSPPTHVFAQGGVGGLAAAVFARLHQHYGSQSPRMIVVEPEDAACLQASARNGRLTTVKIERETLMAGLSCGEPSAIAWTILADLADDFIAVSDSGVGPAMRQLGQAENAESSDSSDPTAVAGESAVAGLVALTHACNNASLKTALNLTPISRILLFGTEGSTDPDIYQRIMAAS
ncbi:MAG: diaminopropionate ammonia-lyase [Burkholderiaceae bacterium]